MQNEHNSTNPQQEQIHADSIQSEIDTLHAKAESSSGEEKQGIMNRIQELSKRKDDILTKLDAWKSQSKGFKDKAKGFMDTLGM